MRSTQPHCRHLGPFYSPDVEAEHVGHPGALLPSVRITQPQSRCSDTMIVSGIIYLTSQALDLEWKVVDFGFISMRG